MKKLQVSGFLMMILGLSLASAVVVPTSVYATGNGSVVNVATPTETELAAAIREVREAIAIVDVAANPDRRGMYEYMQGLVTTAEGVAKEFALHSAADLRELIAALKDAAKASLLIVGVGRTETTQSVEQTEAQNGGIVEEPSGDVQLAKAEVRTTNNSEVAKAASRTKEEVAQARNEEAVAVTETLPEKNAGEQQPTNDDAEGINEILVPNTSTKEEDISRTTGRSAGAAWVGAGIVAMIGIGAAVVRRLKGHFA